MMRIRWRYHDGRYELVVYGIRKSYAKVLVVIGQVWRTRHNWSAVWIATHARAFKTKAAAMAHIEERLTAEVMSVHERRK